MLILDETTLFYFNLRTSAISTAHKKDAALGLVKNWRERVKPAVLAQAAGSTINS
jgi:hypothetical protein